MPDTQSVIVQVADAVVDALNGAEFTFGFEARRAYIPIHDLRELGDLRVTVVPAGLTATTLDRTPRHTFDHVVDVGIFRKVDPERIADVDALMRFAEEVVDLLRVAPLDLDGIPSVRCIGVANDPIFDPGLLDEKRVFASVATFTYRLFR